MSLLFLQFWGCYGKLAKDELRLEENMSKFLIFSDSTCDLNKELRERFDIAGHIAGFVTYPDGHSEEADVDWERTTPEAFFEDLHQHNTEYKTAAPGPVIIEEYLEPFVKEGNDILLITLSSGMSVTYSNSAAAAAQLMEKYPDRKIIVVDSKRYSTALAMMCIYASKLRAEGKSLEETADWLIENRSCFHEMGPLDDLMYLMRVGRVKAPAAIMGTLIGIKPMADFDESGMSKVLGKARGYNKAFRATVGYMQDTIVDPTEQIIFVAHSNRKEKAEKLAELIRNTIHPKEIIVNSVGQSCGVNIGPGLISAFYFGKPISSEMKEEAEILARHL